MKRSRFESILHVAGLELDTYDLWGSTLSLHFDVCLVLDASDVEGDVSPEPFDRWQYRRGAMTAPSIETLAGQGSDENWHAGEWADDYSFGAVMLGSAYESEEITQADLIYAGDVLAKYAGLLRSAGLDY